MRPSRVAFVLSSWDMGSEGGVTRKPRTEQRGDGREGWKGLMEGRTNARPFFVDGVLSGAGVGFCRD